jgi:thioredoxin reductase
MLHVSGRGPGHTGWHDSWMKCRETGHKRQSAFRFGTCPVVKRIERGKKMSHSCDVAIVGAGPYGLSLAAHLRAQGVSFRIFGKPLDTWRSHMPRNMLLKSEGMASSLSAPEPNSTLKDYAAQRGIGYADHGLPVALDTFNAYAGDFLERFVPDLEETLVTAIARGADDFTLTLETGERVQARSVVLAIGITPFAHTPDVLSALPPTALSHSFDHRDASQFKGLEIVVLGAGASAIDTAALLDECSASVRIVARSPSIRFHTPPDADGTSLLKQLHKPPTGIGPGWRSFFCVNMPLMFHRLPEGLRLRATRTHLGPAPGWFMRERIEGRIPSLLGQKLVRAQARGRHVTLQIADSAGQLTLTCDHVVAATGYRPNLDRLTYLAPELRERIATVQKTPILTDNFETSVRGLYFTGPAAANSFGPLMRFMVGAEFAAPRLAAHLQRRLGVAQTRRAA